MFSWWNNDHSFRLKISVANVYIDQSENKLLVNNWAWSIVSAARPFTLHILINWLFHSNALYLSVILLSVKCRYQVVNKTRLEPSIQEKPFSVISGPYTKNA